MNDLSEYYKIYYGQNKQRINAMRRKKYRDEIARRKEEQSDNEFNRIGSYSREYRLWHAAKARAKTQNLAFNIEICDIQIPEFCPILGLKLDTDFTDKTKQSSPSLDKIHPELGYIKGNIAIISLKANRMKSDLDLMTLNSIIKYIKEAPDLEKIWASQKDLKAQKSVEEKSDLPANPELYESDLFKAWKDTLLESLG